MNFSYDTNPKASPKRQKDTEHHLENTVSQKKHYQRK